MTISNPSVNLQIKGAIVPISIHQRKILFIGQKTASGTAVSGNLYQSLEIETSYNTLFGKDSILAAMVRKAQLANSISKSRPVIDAIPFDDAGGAVAATGSITFTDAPTENGSIFVTVGSNLDNRYELELTTSDNPTAIGDALVSAIVADDTSPVTAINASGIVTFTAKNKGTVGNSFTIIVEGSVAGLTIVQTNMSSGVTDPDISSVPTTIQNLRYTSTCHPVIETWIDVIVPMLETRFNQTDPIIKDGQLIVVGTDTFANFASSTVAQNKKTIVYFAHKKLDETYHKGSLHGELDYAIAAHITALRELRLTEGSFISSIVNTPLESNDNFGGISLATLPYHNTPLEYVPLTDPRLAWSTEELEELEDKGFAIFGNNEANSGVLLGEVTTRYKTNIEGQADVSFKYLNYVDQASVSREYATNYLKATFRQYRMSSKYIIPKRNIASVGFFRSTCMDVYASLVELAIYRGGEDERKAFKNALSVVFDYSLGKVTFELLNPAVTQVRDIVGIIQTTFSISISI